METLLVGQDGGVLTVTLNRPQVRNAMNDQMWDELLEVFRGAATHDAVRVIVIAGAGGAFCSGADLSGSSGLMQQPLVHMRHVGDVALALHRLPKPTIAKVGGVAAGAGCNLALGCDLVVASDEARFSEIFARRGLSIDFGGSWVLPRLIGLHKAKELAFFAEVISAAEAERFGIVNRVVPAAELDAFVDDWAKRLAAGPPLALSMTKTLLNASSSATMDEALEDEARSQAVNLRTSDASEAMRAFVEKRDPTFTGT
ncbi:MAG: enoyl-CoA hydratase/isomerase family protein [Acidimicrobiales bacterium]